MIYIFVALFVLVLVYRLIYNSRYPPGPWSVPILGYLPFLNPKAPHLTLMSLAEKYGPVYGLCLGNVYTVVLSDASLISSVFSKDMVCGRAPLYVTHGIMGGYGLICAEGEMWRIHRMFVAKSLRLFGATKSRTSKTEALEAAIMKEVLSCVESLKAGSGSEKVVDPTGYLQHNLGSFMCYLVFGKTWSRDDPIWKWLQHLQETGTKAIGVAGPLNFLPFLRFLPKYSKTMNFLLDGKHKTHKIYQALIEEQTQNFDVTNSDVVPENIIQAFLKERETTADIKYFNDQQFYHLLADVFGAGLDTTLTTLRWYLLYMAAYPKIQAEIQTELTDVLQNRLPTLEDLPSLPLTQASIAETQRIRSVVPVGIPHATTENVTLFNYEISKGTMIIPLQWAVHMNPKIWKCPNIFDPNRFINDEGRFYKPKDFLPFQSGKRMCIGDELANMLLFLFGATILQKFHIRAENRCTIDLEGEIGITLTPKEQALVFISRQ